MKSQNPEVSIIMATYNRAHLILETLNSLVLQSFTNWECLIIDDGSDDATEQSLSSIIKKDLRFKFFKRPSRYRKGLSGCRNYGIDLSKGEKIIFFDDDDIVHPENLQICLNNLLEEKVKFCRFEKRPFTGKKIMKAFTQVEKYSRLPFGIKQIGEMITGKTAFASCCVMWKKGCFDNERFNEDLMYAEDWECYSRILAGGAEGGSLDCVLYYNRKHAQSNTGEFQNNDPIRRKSKIKAANLIIEYLDERELLNKDLELFFLRMGFELKSIELIKHTLDICDSGLLRNSKYILGYYLYPILKPLFKVKGKLMGS